MELESIFQLNFCILNLSLVLSRALSIVVACWHVEEMKFYGQQVNCNEFTISAPAHANENISK